MPKHLLTSTSLRLEILRRGVYPELTEGRLRMTKN